MRMCIGLVCALLTAPPPFLEAGATDGMTVDSLLTAASDRDLPYKQRVRIVKDAMHRDSTGRSMHALARLYIAKGTVSSRYDAALWLDRAFHREPDNAEYRLTRARLYWLLGESTQAHRQVRRILDVHPDPAEALYLMGRHSASAMMRYLDAEKVDYVYEGADASKWTPFSMEDFTAEDRDRAISYLTRALVADPGHEPALTLLGLIYYEAGLLDRMIDLFEKNLARQPDDLGVHLYLGLGYQGLDQEVRAYRSYVAGLEGMPERDRMAVEAVFLDAAGKGTERRESLISDSGRKGFWTRRDPLYLTPINERLLEHCGRVAYANLRFDDPLNGIPGWATDKGQTFIRYGRPPARRYQPGQTKTWVGQPYWYRAFLTALSERGPVRLKTLPQAELWDYEGFQTVFMRTVGSGRWTLDVAWIGHKPLGYRALVDRIPELYKDPYRWDRYATPHQIAQFRGEDDRVRVEVYYALAGEQVAHRTSSPGVMDVDVTQGLYVFDARWDTVRTTVGRVQLMPWITDQATGRGYLFAGERVTLEPGTYHVAAEVKDRNSETFGSFRDSVQVRRFSRNVLEVSSLLLARRVVERDDGPSDRERFMVLPNPLGKCERNGQAHFYFEVYNLTRDEFGRTHYDVAYQVRGLAEGDEDGDPKWTTAVSHTYNGTRSWEPHTLALDLGGIGAGPLAFRVLVSDLQGRQEATSSTAFRVTW